MVFKRKRDKLYHTRVLAAYGKVDGRFLLASAKVLEIRLK